jgi:hypothetical protein
MPPTLQSNALCAGRSSTLVTNVRAPAVDRCSRRSTVAASQNARGYGRDAGALLAEGGDEGALPAGKLR